MTIDDPRVTVAIVAYEHAEFVAQCIESMLSQTIPVKLIVIDDFSPDRTQSVIREVVAQHHDTRDVSLMLNERNRGLPANLNAALAQTDTEFFVYIAGDDWSVPDRLRKQVVAMDAAGETAGLCYTDCLRARPDGSFHPELFSQNHAHVFRPQSTDPFRDLLLIDNWIPAPTVMFRTAALRHIGGFDESIRYEDHDSYVRVARDYQLIYVDEPLSVHRELDRGLGVELFQPGNLDWLSGQIRMERKQLGHDDALDKELTERLRVRAIRLLKQGGDARLVASTLATVARARKRPDPALWAYWTAATLGIAFRR